jgi:hypothetical protein
MFITAKNLSPIPSGPETILVLHVQLSGEAFLPGPIVNGVRPPLVATKVGHTSASMAGTSQLFAGAGPPPVVLAEASIAGGSHMVAVGRDIRGAVASIAGVATLNALAIEGGIPPQVLFGSSTLTAFAGVKRAYAATITGVAHSSGTLVAHRGVAATPAGSSAVAASIKAKWAANATIHGNSAVTANATVTHKAESFPVGIASVSATAT